MLAGAPLPWTLGGNIPVPNGSFELPQTGYVSINIDSWQKFPKPAAYDEQGGFLWTQLTGAFKNTDASQPDHLDNCDGQQALWIFAVSEAGLFQDYNSVDYHGTPTHAFNATFEPGKFYSLTVGVNGGGGGMLEGATLDVSLYYLNAAGAKVIVDTTTITHSIETFPTHTHFVDFHVHLPIVAPTDAWAGKRIGIQLRSTVSEEMEGGYWDIDHVRLGSGPDPLTIARETDNVRVAWPSLPGYAYQLQFSDNLVEWTNEVPTQPGTGGVLSKLYPLASPPKKFFRTAIFATP